MSGYFPSPQKQYIQGVITEDACYECRCTCGFSYVEEIGGDEGFSVSFPLITEGNTNATFNISGFRGGVEPDIVKVYANSSTLYESDCSALGFNSGPISIPAGTTNMQIEVIPNCTGGIATYWELFFLISCT
jgi:hypothetical protein